MSDTDRRGFLKAGAAAGVAGLVGTGCAAVQEHFQAPGAADLLALDMDGFLHRLDSTLGFLRSSSSLGHLLSLPEKRSPELQSRVSGAAGLARDALRSLLLVTSFAELPEAGQAHPGMQARMWSAMDELDDAVLGMHRTMTSLTPTERADVTRALRQDPSLRARVLAELDREGERAGVSASRRAHMARIGEHVTFRLRQSATSFYDDLDRKMEKVATRELTPDESERRLRAMLGDAEFEAKRTRMLAYAQAWQSVPGIAQGAPPPGNTAPPMGPVPPAGAAPPGSPLPSATPLPPAGAIPSAGAVPSIIPSAGGAPPGAPLPSATAAATVAAGVLAGAPPVVSVPVTSKSLLVPARDYLLVPMRPQPRRGVWTLRAGGMLFGLGVLHGLQGLTLLATGNFIAAFEFTHGALQIFGGIVTLIIGGVQYSASSPDNH